MSKSKKFEFKQAYIFIVIVVLALVLKLYQTYYWPTVTVKMHNTQIKVLVADNQKHWEKGVGGRDNLGEYGGMLFIFPETSQHIFVMRDTKFSLDMVWLKKGEVVDIAPNVPTELGRTEEQLTQYLARDVSNMVLEMPAGSAQNYGLKIGDKVEISK